MFFDYEIPYAISLAPSLPIEFSLLIKVKILR
jgi:hypothetical protein